jgi:hypothetical protein
MKSHQKLALAAAASVGLAGLTSSAHAARLLYYGFEDGTDTTIDNRGTTALAGTLVNPTRASFVTGQVANVPGIGNVNTGRALRLSPESNNNTATDAYVQSNQTAPQLAASTGTYTMMAWVNVATGAFTTPGPPVADNDNMVFGQVIGGGNPPDNNQYLHNGFRGNRVHQGHWGNDEQRTGQDLQTDTWYHVAYVYENQEMTQYVNGVAVSPDELEGTPPTNNTEGPLLNLNNITIGKTEGNGGNFNGIVDEVKMFDTALTAAQIQQEALVNVPEPTALGVLGVGVLGLLSRRRRR